MIHIASCSFGKDSMATILLALRHKEPLDMAVYVEVMFDAANGISGEVPEHIEWINDTAIPRLEAMGVKVVTLRRSDYLEQFNRVITRGRRKGQRRGFPMSDKCAINRECKVGAVREYYKTLGDNITQYVGIAIDEPKRLARLKQKKNTISLLEKYGYTEAMARNLAEEYGLLSPIYGTSTRNGCWFCPNQRIGTACAFRKNHPELWGGLRELGKEDIEFNKFTWHETIEQFEERMDRREKRLALQDMQLKLDLFDEP